ncbi:hypothetical protein BC792_1271 [Sphingobacterium allocomposti]|jgi:hypothetical protein|uniref:Uncharacterized protein n=1 Tax=Sphingobacterium allocomposti TaxID=415956 RepID=A0A5S5D042_9SPHI|nr:hypothetical protein [Sphingobacterium composti Yoo et al. 2007 non Ten et al. 2007]TYP89400.1 hypothetical protein BC792_1271 [Sphingobacterium composti Yoo et al. 2007 non Ten et al. 2007]HLS96405.1 hypothetical protein [Sphingobacterium sp.]
MMQVAEQEVLIDEIINFNGPEDDADDVYDDDFGIMDEIDSIGEFDDFDDDDF